MRTKLYFVAALAATMLASCADDKFVGDNSPNELQKESTENAINFGGGFRAVTRANSLGADAATLLGGKFYVTGVKGDGTPANMVNVFNTYSVVWTENTAGNTESNTSDWDYVGKTHDFSTSYTPNISSQTIKYWDYNTNYYDFAAYSLGKETSKATGTAITYQNDGSAAYTLAGTAEQLSTCYITDMKTVAKVNYGGEVTLNFRSLATKVRMAIYETIPGYSVKDVVFYTDNTTGLKATILDSSDPNYSTGIHEVNATLFGTSAFYTNGTYEVKFPTIGISNENNSDYNKAHVTMKSDPAPTSVNTKNFGTLNYVAGEGSLTGETNYLGRTSTTASFAGNLADNYYQIVLPNEDGVVLEMRVNYTLVSNDGSNEVITIHGAKAFVPLTFTKWMSNYAYTYIFKISDNTNGWSSLTDTDPAGLYPITFDAVVLDPILSDTEQTTITTVAMPSITTYQKGHLYTAGNEYSAAKGKIYVQVYMEGATPALRNDLGDNGKLYEVTGSTPISEATVMDALAIKENTGVGRNGLTLTLATTSASVKANITAIPGENGNNITVVEGTAAEFTPSANKTYAYVYDTQTWNGVKVVLTGNVAPTDWVATSENVYYSDAACKTKVTTAYPDGGGTYYKKEGYIYTAKKCDSKPGDEWDTAGVWYQDPDGKTPVVSWTDSFAGKTFYRKYSVDGKIYGVKVIKVID